MDIILLLQIILIAISAKEDDMTGLKANIIAGHLEPLGTGMRQFEDLRVASKEEYERLASSKI